MSTAACPLCRKPEFSLLFSVKDYTVSGEEFPLVRCTSCGFVFTQQAPSQGEIGRYYQSEAYISHTDSKDGLLNKLYQLVRKRALHSKRRLIEGLMQKDHGRLLDYGCGTGAFISTMQSSGWKVQGIEPDPGARSKASALTQLSVAEPSQLGEFPSESFDVITLWHVLEHVHDLHSTLTHFGRTLQKNGLMLIAVPNHTSYDAAHYRQYWAAYDVPRHLYHFDPASMQALMNLHGFKVVEIKPMWFDAFYVSLLSEQYRTGKMRPFQALLIGFLSNLHAMFRQNVCSSQIYVIRKTDSLP